RRRRAARRAAGRPREARSSPRPRARTPSSICAKCLQTEMSSYAWTALQGGEFGEGRRARAWPKTGRIESSSAAERLLRFSRKTTSAMRVEEVERRRVPVAVELVLRRHYAELLDDLV